MFKNFLLYFSACNINYYKNDAGGTKQINTYKTDKTKKKRIVKTTNNSQQIKKDTSNSMEKRTSSLKRPQRKKRKKLLKTIFLLNFLHYQRTIYFYNSLHNILLNYINIFFTHICSIHILNNLICPKINKYSNIF